MSSIRTISSEFVAVCASEREGVGTPAHSKPLMLELLDKPEPPPVGVVLLDSNVIVFQISESYGLSVTFACAIAVVVSLSSLTLMPDQQCADGMLVIVNINSDIQVSTVQAKVVSTMVESSWVGLHATLTLLLRNAFLPASTGCLTVFLCL
jgi:hypothetical protein